MTTATITRRTRNLGYALSTRPTGNGTEIAAPTHPTVTGTPRQILAAIQQERARVGYGTYTSERLFIGGEPVMWSRDVMDDIRHMLDGYGDAVTVHLGDDRDDI